VGLEACCTEAWGEKRFWRVSQRFCRLTLFVGSNQRVEMQGGAAKNPRTLKRSAGACLLFFFLFFAHRQPHRIATELEKLQKVSGPRCDERERSAGR
jgi:hypothetical protein